MPTVTPKHHGLGWHPSTPDKRDELYAYTFPQGVTVPSEVDHRTAFLPTILDQGSLGSCTAFAGKYGLQYTDFFNNKPADPISELFEYYQERVIERSTSYDSGAEMRDVFKAMQKYGCAPEILWPYDITKFAEKPSTKAYTAAKKDKIKSYHKVQQVRSLLQACLAAKNIFLIGISVYDSFESDAVAATGMVPMPNLQKEQLLGGHAICCVGYSDLHQYYIFLNSWGNKWGDLKNFPGCMYIPYQYIEDSSLAGDCYTITALS